MAIRYRKEYQSWQVYWNDSHGKRRSKTFGTRSEAQKYNALILALGSGRDDEADITSSVKNHQTKTLDCVYLAYVCEKQFTKRELGCHRSNCQFFLKKLEGIPIADITTQDLEQVKQEMLSAFSPATAHNRLSILRTLIYYAIRKGYMPSIVFPKIPSAHYKRFIPPTPDEIRQMYAVAPPHLQRVLIFGSAFGVRIGQSELFSLKWTDIDLERRILRVHGARKNEAAAYREVPIRADLLPIIALWKAEDALSGCQNIIQYKGSAVKSVKRSWGKMLADAGISRHIRPYDLRHAFGTELVAAGTDIATVASLMGHSSPQMLYKHYLFVMDRQKIQAVENLPVPPINVP